MHGHAGVKKCTRVREVITLYQLLPAVLQIFSSPTALKFWLPSEMLEVYGVPDTCYSMVVTFSCSCCPGVFTSSLQPVYIVALFLQYTVHGFQNSCHTPIYTIARGITLSAHVLWFCGLITLDPSLGVSIHWTGLDYWTYWTHLWPYFTW